MTMNSQVILSMGVALVSVLTAEQLTDADKKNNIKM